MTVGQLERWLHGLDGEVFTVMRSGEAPRQVPLRVTRAYVERELRELHGPWSRPGGWYDGLMRYDLATVRQLAGHHRDFEDLFDEYPKLLRELTWC